jgi:hypothetical protein
MILGGFFGLINGIALIILGVILGHNSWSFQQRTKNKLGICSLQPTFLAYYGILLLLYSL